LKLGDFSWLVKAAEAKPFDIEALDKEVKGGSEVPSSVDPGRSLRIVAGVLLTSVSGVALLAGYGLVKRKRYREGRDQALD
jgi:hypothetical protein